MTGYYIEEDLNNHKEEFEEAAKDSFKAVPDEFERRMKLARDEIFRKLCTALDMEMEQIHIYNLSMILSQRSLYDAYEARAEALGLPLESVIIASVRTGVSLERLLGCLESPIENTYETRIPASEVLYGYSSMSFVFDEGPFDERAFVPGKADTYEESISSLKKRIKYCKNPMEKKNLEKELNAVYKSRKRRK